MKTNRLFWALGWVTMGSLAALQGCGGDDDDGGTGGTSSGGSAGKGGSSGKGGTAGSSGKGGTAGTAGSSGKGGTAGTAGTSGAGGAPGGVGGEGGAADPGDRATTCAAYCAMYYLKECDQADTNTYNDEDDCTATCVAQTWELGTPGMGMGDTIHCRLTHATLASALMTPDEMHCGHASEDSTGNCVP